MAYTNYVTLLLIGLAVETVGVNVLLIIHNYGVCSGFIYLREIEYLAVLSAVLVKAGLLACALINSFPVLVQHLKGNRQLFI